MILYKFVDDTQTPTLKILETNLLTIKYIKGGIRYFLGPSEPEVSVLNETSYYHRSRTLVAKSHYVVK